MKKKVLALMLAMSMVLGMGTTAMAGDETENVNRGKLVKEYQNTNSDKTGVAPAETFEFSFAEYEAYDNEGKEATGVKYPTIGDNNKVTMAFDEAETQTADFEINIEGVSIGKYIYKVTETDNETAGMTYNVGNKELYLVVTVERVAGSDGDADTTKQTAAFHYETEDGNKVGSIVNKYEAGSLVVSKTISGNMANMSKQFAFTITFTAPEGKTVTKATDITYETTDAENKESGEITFDANGTAKINVSLGHGEKVTVNNLPAGVTYTVEEDSEEYTQKNVTAEAKKDIDETEDGVNYEASGEIKAGDSDTVSYENELDKTVDTGVSLDSLPYIIMLAIVAVAAVMFFRKKRYSAM